MYKIIKTRIRPNLDTKFYSESTPEYQQYFKKNYIDTGKILWQERKLSEDNLSLIITTMWKSRSDFLSYNTDPIVYNSMTGARKYDDENNIEATTTVEKGNP